MLELESSILNDEDLLIIDGYGFIFRAYYASPSLTSPAGDEVGALYGFTSMLLKIIGEFKPKKAAIIFDSGGKNFRHEIYSKYKANRPEISQDLIFQLSLVRKAASALNFHIIEKKNYEADDIIATIAKITSNQQKNLVIITADKDLSQLMNQYTKIYDPLKNKYISNQDIFEKYGVTPDHLQHVMALIGDKSDNIPGVRSIGPKIAANLITQFGSLQNLYNNLDQVENARQKNILAEYRDDAFLSFKLVALDSNVELDKNIEHLDYSYPENNQIACFLEIYGFKSLTKRVENLFKLNITKPEIHEDIKYNLVKIESEKNINQCIDKALQFGIIAIYCNNQDNVFLFVNEEIYHYEYDQDQSIDLFNFEQKTNIQLLNQYIKSKIHSLLEDISVRKITFGLKNLLKIFDFSSEKISSFDDIELIYYLNAKNSLFNNKIKIIQEKIDEIIKTIPKFVNIAKTSIKSLQEDKLFAIYRTIDLPLVCILHKMEIEGIGLDAAYLKQLSNEFSIKISLLEKEIWELAGTNFNIASHKQVGEILFEKMLLPYGKILKKSKSYMTDVDILEKLENQGYKIASLLLQFRQLSKLKNTYSDNLVKQINHKTGRIHTKFSQTVTTTARLSSSEPNLQNIPIRDEEGRRIRQAFVAKANHKLISFDYSQIELKILASMANVAGLKEAFNNDRDVHIETAMNIFNLKLDDVNTEYRRKAKTINFGVIYGIGAFGLSKQLNISRPVAAKYIEKYFEKYPEIKNYMEDTINFAKKNLYVKNLFGRKCFTPLINDSKHAMRQFAERAAINAPIQSTSADIIKIAMINIDKMLTSSNFKTKLLLQIHDELIFEAPISEVDIIIPLIKNIMEDFTNIMTVKTTIDYKFGDNLDEIK